MKILKTLVTSAPCLKIFESKLPTCLRTTANSLGLSSFHEQNYRTTDNKKWELIDYSLQALQNYKKCYAQIEKETLSTVFEAKCFHEYLNQ